MSMILRVLPFLLSVLLLQGCFIQSLEPFYTDTAVFEDISFKGKWTLVDKENQLHSIKPWVFSNNEILTYNQKGVPSTLIVRYFKVKNELFADITANFIKEDDLKSGIVNEWWINNTVHAYSIFKVKASANTLDFIMLDHAWLTTRIKNNEISLSSSKSGVYTASSQDWAAFLEKYADSTEAFNEAHGFHFVKRKK